MVEAVREGNDADQKDKGVDLFDRPTQEQVRVDKHHWILVMDDLCQNPHPKHVGISLQLLPAKPPIPHPTLPTGYSLGELDSVADAAHREDVVLLH